MVDDRRLSSGVTGLDDVLHGGFPAGYMCLIEGTPGAGKTTVGLQFIVDGLRYRRLILTLKERLAQLGATTLLLDYQESGKPDHQLETICHGVIALEQRAPEYGTERRRLIVRKMRGVEYRSGFHDFTIRRGGLEVYPRLTAMEHQAKYAPKRVALGVPEMDTMLGGGLDRGTSTLIIGPAGVGKSSLAGHYAFSSAEAGDKVAMFLFEEVSSTFLDRTEGLHIGLRRHVTGGQVSVCQLNSAAVSPGEFASLVRDAVEKRGVKTVIIDSINGYFSAMPQEHFLSAHLHELLTYLNQQGVMTLLIVSQHGVLGPTMIAPVDISYLADSVVLLRFFESEGAVRQAISIVKKRSGPHERTIREFFLGPKGVRVGKALSEFRGILTGNLLSTGSERGLNRGGGDEGSP
jgi:circadian clock protein KaiC